MKKKQSKQLRFAALIRVSSDSQAEKGRSLATQREAIENAVRQLQGRIVETYGGSESATADSEKLEVSRLIEDAERKKFNAVICYNATRWSRDNHFSKQGLRRLRDANCEFYLLNQRQDLFDASTILMLGLYAEFGEFQVASQTRSALLSKIKKAKEHRPTGSSPYARIFKDNKWKVDREKKAKIVECAKRYLKGESLSDLAREVADMDASSLHRILTEKCGSIFIQRFHVPGQDVVEIPTKVPALLPDRIIKRIKAKCTRQRTYHRKQRKHEWPLSRKVKCAICHRSYSSQLVRDPKTKKVYRYLRHLPRTRCDCEQTQRHLNAERLEVAVVEEIQSLASPVVAKKAIQRAIPNAKSVSKKEKRLKTLASDIKRTGTSINRVVQFIATGKLTDEEAEAELNKLRQRREKLEAERSKIEHELKHVVTQEQLKYWPTRLGFKLNRLRRDPAEMSLSDRKELIDALQVKVLITPKGFELEALVKDSQSSCALRLNHAKN